MGGLCAQGNPALIARVLTRMFWSMSVRTPIAVGEWYHCYTRGIDKRKTFLNAADYTRFLETLYLSNNEASLRRSDSIFARPGDVFKVRREKPLVSVAAYCLMPNHFHLLLQETVEGGLARYMQKVGTAYAMYFNTKYERVGSLFVNPYRSKHIHDDEYLRHVAQYIHLNPAELYDQNWKLGRCVNVPSIVKKLQSYQYSSLLEYLGNIRPESRVVDVDALEFIADRMPTIHALVQDAHEYYGEINRGLEPPSAVKASPRRRDMVMAR